MHVTRLRIELIQSPLNHSEKNAGAAYSRIPGIGARMVEYLATLELDLLLPPASLALVLRFLRRSIASRNRACQPRSIEAFLLVPRWTAAAAAAWQQSWWISVRVWRT